MKYKVLIPIIVVSVISFFVAGYSVCGQNPILFLAGYQIHQVAIATDKAEYKVGETVEVTVRNSGTIPVTLYSGKGGSSSLVSTDGQFVVSQAETANVWTFYPCDKFNTKIFLDKGFVRDGDASKLLNQIPVKVGEYEISVEYDIVKEGRTQSFESKYRIKVIES